MERRLIPAVNHVRQQHVYVIERVQ
jgi:hypothetical protein